MEPGEEEEASQMSDGWNDECVLVLHCLANTICKWGEILALWLRNQTADPSHNDDSHAI